MIVGTVGTVVRPPARTTRLANFPVSCTPAVRKLVETGALPAFPTVNQLDGSPNAADDCFVVAPADCMNWLTGSLFTGVGMLDAIYGPGYSGGGDSWNPAALAFYEAHGCHLDDAQWADDNNVGDVLAYVRRHIDAGHPCLMTWPSQWGIETRDTTGGYHAVAVYGYEPDGQGGAVSYDFANPWGGIYQTYDADWVASRCVNAGAMWKAVNVDVSNLGAGFAAYVQQHGIAAPQVSAGEVRTNDPRYPGESFATFADGTILYYTAAMGVRADRGPWLVTELWGEVQAAQATIAKLQAQLAAASAPQPATLVINGGAPLTVGKVTVTYG